MPDLFGEEIVLAPGLYAASPGSGPKGERCRTCQHDVVLRGNARDYHKCGRMRAAWTNGAATDIRARAPACAFWEKKA